MRRQSLHEADARGMVLVTEKKWELVSVAGGYHGVQRSSGASVAMYGQRDSHA